MRPSARVLCQFPQALVFCPRALIQSICEIHILGKPSEAMCDERHSAGERLVDLRIRKYLCQTLKRFMDITLIHEESGALAEHIPNRRTLRADLISWRLRCRHSSVILALQAAEILGRLGPHTSLSGG